MEPREYLTAAWRRRWWIIATVAIVVLVALAVTFTMPRRYTASVLVRATTPGAFANDSVRADATTYLDRLENTYIKLGTSSRFKSDLVKQLNVKGNVSLAVRPLPNSELLVMSATTDNAKSAALVANGMSTALLAQIQKMNDDSLASMDAEVSSRIDSLQASIAKARAERDTIPVNAQGPAAVRRANLDAQIATDTTTAAQLRTNYEQARLGAIDRGTSLGVVDDANPPSGPSSPNLKLNLAIALLIGLVVAFALAFVLEAYKRGSRSESADLAAEEPQSARIAPAQAQVGRVPPPPTVIPRVDQWANGREKRVEPAVEPESDDGPASETAQANDPRGSVGPS
jgi:uncharacterized protein involved in exopolysaccharide biosynthesis